MKEKEYLTLYPWVGNSIEPFSHQGKSLYRISDIGMSDELKKMYIDDCKRLYREFKDKIRPLSVWSNMENINDIKEWHWLMNRVRNENVKLKHTKYEQKAKLRDLPKEPIKSPTIPLSSYSKDDIVKLMKNFYVYATATYFIHLRKHDDFTKQFGTISLFNLKLCRYVIGENGEKVYCNDNITRHLMSIGLEYDKVKKYVKDKLEEIGDDVELIQQDKDLLFEQYHYMAIELCYDIQNFFINGGVEDDERYYETKEAYSNIISLKHLPLERTGDNIELYYEDIENGVIPNIIEEMHSNDEVDIEYGRASMRQVYDFVWNTLQYLDEKQLKELVDLADNKYEFVEKKPNHRPLEDKRVAKYDKLNNLIEIYKNRNEAMKHNKISPAMMSYLLAGKRKTYGGFKYKYVTIEINDD